MNDVHPSDVNEGFLMGLLRKITRKDRQEDISEEIMDMVNESHEQGVIKESEAEMIGNIFEFGEKEAEDVMIHRKNIVAIDGSFTVEQAFNFVMEENFSRYPVYDEDIDNVIGILHIRDLLKAYVLEENKGKTLHELGDDLMFEAYCIPETRNISALFKEMKAKKSHMAIVVDEYGQTTGIITMEDILEEIVGNIFDEYDDEEEQIVLKEDGSFIMDGQTTLEDVEDKLEIEFLCEDVDTLNGFLILELGKIPTKEDEGFSAKCGNYNFTIHNVNNKMVDKVLVTQVKDEED
ncbi:MULTISPECIES: hemolysin family protein [Lachnospira]|uniref:Putative hemolysin n=2 Tax=Lachnospira TaxID=28050 RepID=A0A1H5VEW2_9FIRM|nr:MULTISPECIES: hemolysin family protein [Lachnospira]SDN05823.1 putative hemolysin [Lachnospira pectinoschiza]SEF85905.1 putative hemolysin [Lachnospira multipara]